MVAVNSLLYFLLSAGLSSNPDQAQDIRGSDPLNANGLDLSKLCPPNEQLSDCDAHCQKNCTNFAKPFPCPSICVKGCICKEGLVRDTSGKCVEPKKCPGRDTCPRGEHYEQCNAHCQHNCTTWVRPVLCPRLCAHGCVCDKGTIRGPKGKCIKPEKCPKKDSLFEVQSSQEEVSESFCPPNEEYSRCSAHCQRDCSNWADEDFKCTDNCVPGCVCKEGSVRGPGGRCIFPRQCPPRVQEVEEIPVEATFTCPTNEHFTRCDAYCQKNCSNYDKDIPCRKICMWGCICDEGYTRGPDKKCIKIEECEEPETQAIPEASLACPKNEVFSDCEAHCQKNCTNYKKPFACPKICVKGCVCDKGLVRGQDGKCVVPKKCPGKDICPRGEHYDQCKANCQSNCTNWDRGFDCERNRCVHGCVCDLGTIRGPKGKCIKPNQCPKKSVMGSSTESSTESIEQDVPIAQDADEIVCPKYEHLDACGAHCQKNCTNFDKPPMPCPYVCIKGCVCDEGYVRAKNGKCVKPERCPVRDVCLHGEHFDMCQAHCQKNCSNWDKPIACPFICVKGCVCDEGTVRGPHGLCIKADKCPKRSFAESEEQGVGVADVCTLEKKVGPCRARIPRYFFNQETRQCEKFYFGGCEPNENNFVTKEACERICSENFPTECTLEKEVGPCYSFKTRYYFNKETNRCDQFYYGGCLGNENNFESKGLCERKCLSSSRSSAEMTSQEQSEVQAEDVPTECTLDKEVGPCKASIPRYYFNKETNRCERFSYGGCLGNENNFVSKELCERKCLSSSRSSAEMTSQEQSEVQAEELPTECTLEKAEGPCPGYFPRYFFNNETNQCEKFIYGGCRGNENNFLTKRRCEKKCLSGSRTSVDSNSEEESEANVEELPTECTLEKTEGPCPGYFPRYFFNNETNQCEKFIYGGCRGNENNFLTKRRCEKKCLSGSRTSVDSNSEEESDANAEELPTECTLEKEEGPCRGHFSFFYFNKETNKCEQFFYGGCQGNENRFLSKRMCERKCLSGSRTSVDSNPEEESEVGAEGSRTSVDSNSEEESEANAEELPTECTLEKEEGPCRGHFSFFYFNKETNKCEQFFYGGCQGNENRFLSKRMCERKCLSGSRTSVDSNPEEESEVGAEELPTECTLEKEEGPCNGYFPRFFFNKETNKCEQFIFGGCRGNENNFESKRLCERKCLSDSRTASEPNYEEESEVQADELPTECTLEKVEGPCKGHFARFYFNKETNKCEQFFYGGCQGNENRFLSKRMCERKCLRDDSESAVTIWPSEESIALPRECTLPKNIGPCDGYFPRYYYNKETHQCEHFYYGGCRGNENNFDTQEQCEQRCSTTSESDAPLKCPKNEHISDCEAHCQKNCTNYNKPFECPKICVKGCVCDKGLVRGVDGKCVEPKKCPGKDKCPRGEHYDQCKANCQRNCTTWGKPFPCSNICVHGCVCDLGTVRGPKGKCIKPNQCPKKSVMGSSIESSAESIEQDVAIAEASEEWCPKNEEYSACRAHCPGNCKYQEKVCPRYCVSGCKCKRGYVRGPRGDCIKLEECPSKEIPKVYTCPTNERFNPCVAHCQRNCTTEEFVPCIRICVPGCICEEGYIRGLDGKCIPMDQCPRRLSSEEVQAIRDVVEESTVLQEVQEISSQDVAMGARPSCPVNEHWDVCNFYCQRKCVYAPCPMVCKSGCVCDDGLVRSTDGKCIKPEQCEAQEESLPTYG
ncbi:hypothetical protein JTE90_007093 [Oedothorax gibbosus]|uniref:BPTI/Kunitz inhibitor domain-containing protein n=1 Tax=Oedothorax gibbosus TaxID=931172 RepID=A0AAV6VSM7_9ARAC|nr:hypothetical protein JTE90_007093 [Oedothorax gibbosus]KAG8198784.1 hypothetical protein JTE90_007093 [Oedothorax gibbosus]